MADGKMTRWEPGRANPKHLLKIGGETLLERLVRQLKTADGGAKIVVTSHDPRYEVAGAVRYEPKNNVMEIDRFTWELIDEGVCFLYGDTYYTDDAIEKICACRGEDLFFVGSKTSVVAVKVYSPDVMKDHIQRVRKAYLDGETKDCKGWQVYQSFEGLPFGSRQIKDHFLRLEDSTQGFNTMGEYQTFLQEHGLGA